MAGASLNLIKLDYARAVSVGDKKTAETLKAQGEAITKSLQPEKVVSNSGTYQAEEGFFVTSTGTLPNESGRF